MAQGLRALANPPEEMGPIPITYRAAYNGLQFQPQGIQHPPQVHKEAKQQSVLIK